MAPRAHPWAPQVGVAVHIVLHLDGLAERERHRRQAYSAAIAQLDELTALPDQCLHSAEFLGTCGPKEEVRVWTPTGHRRSRNIQIVEAAKVDDFDTAFATIAKERADGLIVLVNPMYVVQQKQIIERAMNNKLPAIYEWNFFVRNGGLISPWGRRSRSLPPGCGNCRQYPQGQELPNLRSCGRPKLTWR